jgi:hypothetical protein
MHDCGGVILDPHEDDPYQTATSHVISLFLIHFISLKCTNVGLAMVMQLRVPFFLFISYQAVAHECGL